MKKKFLLLFYLAALGSTAFSLDSAIGGGFLYNSSVIRFVIPIEGYNFSEPDSVKMGRNGIGGYLFLGITRFFELNVAFVSKKTEGPEINDEPLAPGEIIFEDTITVQAGLIFKYPFQIFKMLAIFPVIGIDFEYTKGITNDYEEDWWNDLWFRGGGGLDFIITKQLFLRTSFVYGFGLPMKSSLAQAFIPKNTTGFLFRAGLGWML